MSRRYVEVWLTEFQAQVVVDAIDMRTEGTQSDTTVREVRELRAVRKKLSATLARNLEPNGPGS